nr:hypothetical protein [uncultured Desulfobulbus sp.]
MLNIRYIITISLCFLCSVSWSFASQQELQRVSPAELGVWGYRQVGFGTMEQTAWEKKSFGEAVKSFKKIKSNKQVPHWPSAYYRFVLTQEEYPRQQRQKQDLNGYMCPRPE